MRVLAACSLGGAGHLQPLVPFLAAARRRGDETLVIGPPALRSMVGRAGFAFAPGGEPAEADVAPIRERLPVAPTREAMVLGNRDLFGRLAARAMLPPMARTCSEWRPSLVLRDPCEYASAVVGPQLGVPTAQVAISLAAAETRSIAAAAPALDELRPGLADELRTVPYLTRFPGSLDPSPFPATFRYRVPEPGRRAAVPDWWDGSRAPLVYLTFGTVLGHMTRALDVYRIALRAVAGLDVRVLLTVGRSVEPADLRPVPANVHVEQWVDQADVLGHADVVVCHGGSGTVFGALAAGVPLVVVPQFADQFANARLVATAGAGLAAPPDKPTAAATPRRPLDDDDVPGIAAAIVAVLAEPSYRERAAALAADMAGAPTVDDVLGQLLARTVADG